MIELKARDVMTREVTTVREDSSLEELIHLLRVSHFSGIPVVDGEGKAVGLVSETDILRALAYTVGPPGSGEFATNLQKGKRRISALLLDAASRQDMATGHLLRDLVRRPVHDLMTPMVHGCSPEATITEVCDMMVWKEIRRVIVLDADRKVVGVISSIDLISRLGAHLKSKGGA